MNEKHTPRFLVAAASSGSGKTLITCGILQVLKNRGLQVASFKCGPDYIDPMFHSRVIGTKSRNLDTFFADTDTVRYLLKKNAADCDIAVLEGVIVNPRNIFRNNDAFQAKNHNQLSDVKQHYSCY